MWWQYLMVFGGAFLMDVFPIPLPPAVTIIVLLQITFDLNLWLAVAAGVAGSIAGRTILAMYIPKVSGKLFKRAKNEDMEYLGRQLKSNGWRGQLLILVYSLMPLPTTPLFIAAGMAKLKPYHIIPAFFVGKVVADTAAVLMGKVAVVSAGGLLEGMVSWKSIAGIVVGLAMLFCLLFFDWRTLLRRQELRLRFAIWR